MLKREEKKDFMKYQDFSVSEECKFEIWQKIRLNGETITRFDPGGSRMINTDDQQLMLSQTKKIITSEPTKNEGNWAIGLIF